MPKLRQSVGHECDDCKSLGESLSLRCPYVQVYVPACASVCARRCKRGLICAVDQHNGWTTECIKRKGWGLQDEKTKLVSAVDANDELDKTKDVIEKKMADYLEANKEADEEAVKRATNLEENEGDEDEDDGKNDVDDEDDDANDDADADGDDDDDDYDEDDDEDDDDEDEDDNVDDDDDDVDDDDDDDGRKDYRLHKESQVRL